MKDFVILADCTCDVSMEIATEIGMTDYIPGHAYISDGRDIPTTLDWNVISREEYYKALSGDGEHVDIQYETELDNAPLDELLRCSFEKDRIMKHTTEGIHRDDFAFTMNGHPIRRYGSQGQQKSFLVSLKFAQYEIMKRNYGFAPILLLDDVFDKLDMGRISNLLQMVASKDFGQIFITDSNKVRMSGIVDKLTKDRAYFETVSGAFTRL